MRTWPCFPGQLWADFEWVAGKGQFGLPSCGWSVGLAEAVVAVRLENLGALGEEGYRICDFGFCHE